LPKTSQKKKDELERALREKKCSFARYDPHLPIEGMAINEVNVPISPSFLKMKNEAAMK